MKSGCQIYIKGSIEAAEFYKQAFNLTVGMIAHNKDGTYEHISLMSGDDEIIAIAEDAMDYCNDEVVGGKCPIMAFNVYDISSHQEVDRIFTVLSQGARWNENPNGACSPVWDDCGDFYGFNLVDKFGVHWGVLTGNASN